MSRDQILVVDDNEDIRIFVRAALTPEGFDVIEASNGADALAIFKKSEPAVIILDLRLANLMDLKSVVKLERAQRFQ